MQIVQMAGACRDIGFLGHPRFASAQRLKKAWPNNCLCKELLLADRGVCIEQG